MRKIIWVIIILIIALAYWWRGSNPAPVASGEVIKIGAIISQTGVAAAFGEMSKFGIELAVKEINEAGGIEGRPVAVIYEDDRTDPKTAAGLYQKLTGIDKVDAIIGSNFDFVTQPIFALAETGEVVVASPSSPRIAGAFEPGAKSFVMMSDFSKIILELKPYLTSSPYKKLGIIHFASAFGAEITKTLTEINSSLGKSKIVEETYNEIGNNDFRTTILKLKDSGVDLVFLDMAGPDPLTFVRQAKQLAYAPVMIADTAIKDSVSMSGAEQALFNGVLVLNWDVTTADFARKFEEIYKRAPGNSVNRAYDAVYVLAQAVAEAESKSDIPKLLETKTWQTPNGPFKFNAEHAAETTAVELQIIKDGQYVKVE